MFNRSQRGFDETNAYYFLDLQQQYIRGLGFAPQWNDSDYIRFDAHGYSGANDSRYNPSGKYLTFGEGGVDDSQDQDVILHEFTHALHHALLPVDHLVLGQDEDIISEGSGDYMALSYRRTLSDFQQDHVYNWDGNGDLINGIPWLGRTLSPTIYYSVENWTNKVDHHIAGIIWASTLMDIHNSSGVGRDVTSKLLLNSFSCITYRTNVIDHINTILQADRDIYNGSHLSALESVFYSRNFFFYNQTSGAINSTQWSGTVYVVGDVTVNSNATLTIAPNTSIYFLFNSSLIVNGTLSADGGDQNHPITFDFMMPNSTVNNGIKFNSGSSGTINYCQIRNADRGIYENNVSVNISNSAISHCNNGIYLYNSNSSTIQYCNIHDNISNGIYLTSSSPTIHNNYLVNNWIGVNCSTSSNPTIGNRDTTGNNITANTYGAFCANNSYPKLGTSSPDYGYNNLINTTYNVYNISSGSVDALNNYWGPGNPPNYKNAGTGSVNTNNTKPSQLPINPAPPLSKISDSHLVTTDIPLIDQLNQINELIAGKNLVQARNLCMNLITNYPDYGVSYNALNLLKDTYAANEITRTINIYTSFFNSKVKKDLYGMAGLILAEIDKENRLSRIEDVINNYQGQSVVELALYDKFVFYYFEKQDKPNAITVSKQLDQLFPLSWGAIEAHRILGDMEFYKINANNEKAPQNITNQSPSEFALIGNYPNPFNPTTKINYQLPKNGYATLKVYDILGREVASLVNENQQAGNYSIPFALLAYISETKS